MESTPGTSSESAPLLQSVRPSKQRWLSDPNLFPQLQPKKNYGNVEEEDVENLFWSRKRSVSLEGIKENERNWKRYIGILLGIVASIFLSLTTLFAKLLVDYHAFSKSMYRFLGILIPSIPILFYFKFVQKMDVFEPIWPLTERTKIVMFGTLFIRAFFGCTASILQFYALDFIAIGDVAVVSFTTPVFVTILAYYVLNEKCGLSSIIAVCVSLLGIVIITRPPILSGQEAFDITTIIGVALALGCTAFATVTYVALRWLRPVDYAVVTFFYGFYSVIECLIFSAITGTLEMPESTEDWILVTSMAALAFLGQTCFTVAMKFEDAGPMSLIRTLEVPLTFLWQILFLAEIPDMWSIIGTMLILTSVVVTGLRKWLLDFPEDNATRRRFRFLL